VSAPLLRAAGLRRRLSGWAVILASGLAAPAWADARFKLGESPVFPTPDSGRAVLYATREQHVRLRPLPVEKLHLDGAPLGFLPQGGYIVTAIDSGQRCVTGIHGTPAFCLDVRPGRTYLLRLREVIDTQDRMSTHWLLDDPLALHGIVAESELRPVQLTEGGRRDLEKRYRDKRVARAEGPVLNPGASDTTVEFANLVTEDPIRRSLRDPARHGTSRLIVTRDRLQLVEPERTIEVPLDSLETVRYGGTRASGPTTWLNIQYSAREGSELVAIADPREELAVETYNRMFAAIHDRWWARTGGTPAAPR
jgi:hypothetical protein